MQKFILVASLTLFSLSGVARGDVISQLSVDSGEGREASFTDPSEWRIKLFHPETKEHLKSFSQLHGRDMHMILVKKDLSSFAHVHPVLIGKTGVFHTIVNQASFDQDNEQALHAVPSAGDYFIFTETSPKDRPELGYIELSRLQITAVGEWKPEVFKLDPVDGGGGHEGHGGGFSITKYFKVEGLPNPEKPWQKAKEFKVLPGDFGDYYKVRMSVSATPGCGGNMVGFHLDVSTWDKLKAAYKRVKEFTPWLGMEAHAIMLQADAGVSAADIQFAHLHGMMHEDHNSLMFSHFDRMLMSGRSYRMWYQIKDGGHVATFPFSFHYMAHYKRGCE